MCSSLALHHHCYHIHYIHICIYTWLSAQHMPARGSFPESQKRWATKNDCSLLFCSSQQNVWSSWTGRWGGPKVSSALSVRWSAKHEKGPPLSVNIKLCSCPYWFDVIVAPGDLVWSLCVPVLASCIVSCVCCWAAHEVSSSIICDLCICVCYHCWRCSTTPLYGEQTWCDQPLPSYQGK